jgi:hypothetical protein
MQNNKKTFWKASSFVRDLSLLRCSHNWELFTPRHSIGSRTLSSATLLREPYLGMCNLAYLCVNQQHGTLRLVSTGSAGCREGGQEGKRGSKERRMISFVRADSWHRPRNFDSMRRWTAYPSNSYRPCFRCLDERQINSQHYGTVWTRTGSMITIWTPHPTAGEAGAQSVIWPVMTKTMDSGVNAWQWPEVKMLGALPPLSLCLRGTVFRHTRKLLMALLTC